MLGRLAVVELAAVRAVGLLAETGASSRLPPEANGSMPSYCQVVDVVGARSGSQPREQAVEVLGVAELARR